MFKRLTAAFVTIVFILSYWQPVPAQDVNALPLPGTMMDVSAPFAPIVLKGLVINPQKPLEFQFMVDMGDSNAPAGINRDDFLRNESSKLVKYFLGGLTIPERDLWVNLSPYEKNRIITNELGQTTLGQDMLAQDYLLKQLSASLIYPEKALGKEFWGKVYSQTLKQFGTTNIAVNTFNKVWILPDQAKIFEHGNAVYVTKATLKVMLDEDYTALNRHSEGVQSTTEESEGDKAHSIGSQIIRQIVLPEIEHEVNYGKNFASLRQIYNALILAKWYKVTIQNTLLQTVYTNKKKISGIDADSTFKEEIYQRYLRAYKKGVFNYIKEDQTTVGQAIPRKYFSGGEIWKIPLDRTARPEDVSKKAMMSLTVNLQKIAPKTKQVDRAAIAKPRPGELPFLDNRAAFVLRLMMRIRYRWEAFEETYGLKGIPKRIQFRDPKSGQAKLMSSTEYADKVTDFLSEHRGYTISELEKKFREEFPDRGLPKGLNKTYKPYLDKKAEVFGIKVFKDILLPNSDVVDVGTGRGQLVKAILAYSDKNHLGIRVVGTDPDDSRIQLYDPRILFIRQPSGISIPIDFDSVDTVILSWVLHHVNKDDLPELLNYIWGISRTGGRLAIMEPLLVDNNPEIRREVRENYEQVLQDKEIYTQGDSTKEYIYYNREYQALNKSEQFSLLPWEDVYGHTLTVGRPMPHPFNYLSVSELRSIMEKSGWREEKQYFKVLGSAPIMGGVGPPSVRMVFTKQQATPYLVLPNTGLNLASRLLDLNKTERQKLGIVQDTLIPRGDSKEQLSKIGVDDIVLFATDHLDVLASALELFNTVFNPKVKKTRIVIAMSPWSTDPVDLINKAVKWGYKISTPKGLIDGKESWIKVRKARGNAWNKIAYTGSSPEIIKQMMIQMIQSSPTKFNHLQKKDIDHYIVPIGSKITGSSIQEYKEVLEREGALTGKYKVVLVSPPEFQLFQEFHLQGIFSDLGSVELMNYTVSTSPETLIGVDKTEKKGQLIKYLLAKNIGTLSMSEYGANFYPIGANHFSSEYWNALIYLFDHLDKDQAGELAKEYYINTIAVEKSDNPALKKFFHKIMALKEKHLADSSMTSSTENGGIDLSGIKVDHARVLGTGLDFAQINEFMQDGFDGFTPVIVKIAPIQDPLRLLGVKPDPNP